MNGGDPAFKLFGMKINPVPESQIHVGDSSSEITNSEPETSQPNNKEECRASNEIQMNSKVKYEVVETNSRAEESF
ncbi:hypothetical protein HRI_001571000 [Hibiscus trionum]|uniref:Uncharacterized protein n=1 Tax=Hibiscus trionum TaxID=183268 RepID=A0A9W7HLG9_HIBTR|nr:hypothetical protein HRI_001571000 [Hibiscus trionum]